MSKFRIQVLEHSPAQPQVTEIVNTPPSHSDGLRVIVGTEPTGSFVGHANKIAYSKNDQWYFDEPKEGWKVWIISEDDEFIYKDGEWILRVDVEKIHDRLHSMVDEEDHKTEIEHADKLLGWGDEGKPSPFPIKDFLFEYNSDLKAVICDP